LIRQSKPTTALPIVPIQGQVVNVLCSALNGQMTLKDTGYRIANIRPTRDTHVFWRNDRLTSANQRKIRPPSRQILKRLEVVLVPVLFNTHQQSPMRVYYTCYINRKRHTWIIITLLLHLLHEKKYGHTWIIITVLLHVFT